MSKSQEKRIAAQGASVIDRIRHRQRGTTHWEGCESQHTDCAAILEIERLNAALERLHQFCQDCPTFLEQDEKITSLTAEVSLLRPVYEAVGELVEGDGAISKLMMDVEIAYKATAKSVEQEPRSDNVRVWTNHFGGRPVEEGQNDDT